MNGWHEDPENWHGPVQRAEQAQVWDRTVKAMVALVFEYRRCGCITTRKADQ